MSETYVDVLVVGAGLSGIGAGYRLQTQAPHKTYAILEARNAIGGTWDLFRYPGVRSDSDMFTLGYPFRPWTNPKSIADGDAIVDYIRASATAYGVDKKIKFGHRVVRASWSSGKALWTVDVRVGDESVTYTCSFLYLCSGYYSYSDGHEVKFVGQGEFQGDIVHPQHWPADLDYRDKNVVVIGSGATAVTLVPAMAEQAAHVTMLQRSPSYVVSRPTADPLADKLRSLMPGHLAHRMIRGRNVVMSTLFYQIFRRWPKWSAERLRKGAEDQLAGTVAIDPHFSPKYNPWDQRLCLVPDGDLFTALREKKADVVTDRIERFTSTGILLASGKELPADVIVTATGLKMVAFGEIELTVDGKRVEANETTVYKGMMFSGIPNLAWCVGYTNNSWTLRADLTTQYVCRLLNHMDRHHFSQCVPAVPTAGSAGSDRPLLDLTSGYIQRAAERLPHQGQRAPWRYRQNYLLDLATMRLSRVDDNVMRFSNGVPDSQLNRKQPA
ncbi:MAG TPA: NAD(P)/FAD-dependent oxidoreductase [Pseudonocardiaceae bacterium]|jgi:cation diffusion facilitator CzcD-associated flavoprotein CzcO